MNGFDDHEFIDGSALGPYLSLIHIYGEADKTAEVIASIVESEKHRVSRSPGAVEKMFFLNENE